MPKASTSSEYNSSCKECRRRKLKCDRKIPCSKCVERGCSNVCPDGVLNSRAAKHDSVVDGLQQRIYALESKLQAHDIPLRYTVPIRPSQSSTAVSAQRETPSPPPERRVADKHWVPSMGTLVLGRNGGARYIGATAASEWLNERIDASKSEDTPRDHCSLPTLNSFVNFPLGATPQAGWPLLQKLLPSWDRTRDLVDIYYDLYAFNYNVIARSKLEGYIETFYSQIDVQTSWNHDSHPHKLGLLFIVIAFGSLLEFEGSASKCSESKAYFEAAEVALSIVSFLKEITIASVQTLHIMANYHVYDDRFRGGDLAWPLGGLAMRLLQAMGLHRDGQSWQLPEEVLEERRRIFWETHTEETFQVRTSHPYPIAKATENRHTVLVDRGMFSRHFDVEYPHDDPRTPFSTTRYKLVRISSKFLEEVMTIEGVDFETVMRLHQEIVDLKLSQPQILLWKRTIVPLPSSSSTTRWSEIPDSEKEELKLALQHTLSLNIAETELFLLRTYFGRALKESPADPAQSRFGSAFTVVVNLCENIIAIAQDLYMLHRRAAVRHWFYWYHACSAAVCMASIPILAPLSPSALQGWLQLQSACTTFAHVAHQSKSSMASLALLLRLRSNAFDKMSSIASVPQMLAFAIPENDSTVTESGQDDEASDDTTSLMGFHTRLIEVPQHGRYHQRILKGRTRVPQLPDASSSTQTGPRLPAGDTAMESPIWEPRYNRDPHENERPMFSFDLPSNSGGGVSSFDPTGDPDLDRTQPNQAIMSQAAALDFDLDVSTFAYLSSMGPGFADAIPPPEAPETPSGLGWDNLDHWLGMGFTETGSRSA